MCEPPIITLTTDFGSCGPYVPAMKGAILSINPCVKLVDVSHEVEPANIREAAFLLREVTGWFPAGTIHVVVVDPGVGSTRRLIAAEVGEQRFVAPDNGAIGWALERLSRGAAAEVIELTARQYWHNPVSTTFHGRDILGPIAAHWSLGAALHELGKPIEAWVQIGWPEPARGPGSVRGEVVYVDRFGNLITNVSADAVTQSPDLVVRCAGHRIGRVARTYSDVPCESLVAVVGSSACWEIAVHGGSAAKRLDARVGAAVEFNW